MIYISINVPIFAQKHTLAIIDLKANGVEEYISKGATDLIRTELHNSGIFNIIERSKMDNVLKKHKLESLSCSEMDCAVKIGQVLAVDMILVGSVIKFGESLIINGRFIDVKNVKLEFAEKAKVTNISLLDEAAEEFAGKIIMRMSGKTPQPKKKYLMRRDNVKNYKLGYISDVIKENNTLIIDIGFLENVKERNIYEIKKKHKRIAWCVVKEVDEYESECEIIHMFEDMDIKRGDKVYFKGRDKVGGMTVFFGVGTPLKGLNDFKLYWFNPGIHFGISFDIILKFGLGFQFNLSWLQSWDHIIRGDHRRYYLDMDYLCPFFVKYHFMKNSFVSPYIGVGVALGLYLTYKYDGSGYLGFNYSEYTARYRPIPVLNFGFSFMSYRRFNLVLDFRYYSGVGAPKFEGKRPAASSLILSLGFHVNI